MLWFSEGEDVRTRSLDEIRNIFRSVGGATDLFVFELDGIPIGDGWAQEMNLPLVLDAFADRRCMRVDLTSAAITGARVSVPPRSGCSPRTHSRGADLVFAVDVADDNERSPRDIREQRLPPLAPSTDAAGSEGPRTSVYLVCRPAVFDGTAPAQPHPLGGTMAADDPKGSTVVLYRRTPELALLVLHRASEARSTKATEHGHRPRVRAFPRSYRTSARSRELHEVVGLELTPSAPRGLWCRELVGVLGRAA